MFSVSCKPQGYFLKLCLELASPLTAQVYRSDFTLDILDPCFLFSPKVRKSKTVLNCGFHTLDS